jgi:hypothetical protein
LAIEIDLKAVREGYPLGLVGSIFLVINSIDLSSKYTTWADGTKVSGTPQVLGQSVITSDEDIQDHSL